MSDGPVIVLSGGVGGAKLVLGLSHTVPAQRLVVITNTGDDFDHFGLRICPDTDTVLYTLSGLADPKKGWGRVNESWTFMQAIADLGGADWFRLGDGDLALHVVRTERLRAGARLTEITGEVARSMGIQVTVLPMCDQPVATMVDTAGGRLAFQEYFVREQCAPRVTGFEFAGIDGAEPNPLLVVALAERPRAIIVAPSNPFVSVDPILEIPGMRRLLQSSGAPIVAVSPIVAGAAIRGPAAKMMAELGVRPAALAIAEHYLGFADGIIIDEKDAGQAPAISALGLQVEIAPTIMHDLPSRIELATRSLAFANHLNPERGGIGN